MHCLVGNATDPILRALASSNGISSRIPLKPQHSNPNPNRLANQLWCINFITPPTLFIIPHRCLLFWISYATQKLMLVSCKMLQNSLKQSIRFCGIFFQVENRILLPIVLLKCPHVQTAFLKFTSCDNEAFVGCLPIPAVAVHLNLKSWRLISHLIRCIAITYWIFKSLRQF